MQKRRATDLSGRYIKKTSSVQVSSSCIYWQELYLAVKQFWKSSSEFQQELGILLSSHQLLVPFLFHSNIHQQTIHDSSQIWPIACMYWRQLFHTDFSSKFVPHKLRLVLLQQTHHFRSIQDKKLMTYNWNYLPRAWIQAVPCKTRNTFAGYDTA